MWGGKHNTIKCFTGQLECTKCHQVREFMEGYDYGCWMWKIIRFCQDKLNF